MKLKKIGVEQYINIFVLLFLLLFPLISSPFRVEMMGKFVVFIIVALALDLLWGYTGLMSLGHAVFFGLGGYILAMSYSIQDKIPDFMSRFGIESIPVFMIPLKNIGVTFILGIIIPGIIAGILGYFIFSSKVSGVFFTIITLALAQIFETFVINQQAYTGGFNGITGIPRLPILGEPLSLNQLYYLIIGITGIVFLFCYWFTKSRFGKIATAIRENESRIGFLGYKTHNFKILIYVISGVLAGLAGMLYVPINTLISPQDVGTAFSTSILVWLAVGGRGNLTGAVVGTLIINWMQSLLSESFADYWQLILGIILLSVIFLMPNGIIGQILKIQYNKRVQRKKQKLEKKSVQLAS